MQVPVVIYPVVGGGWTLEEAIVLLGDLEVQMQARNPTCMGEVMAHVGRQGITDVREVEDALLAHLGLVATLERATRPATAATYLDQRLSARLKKGTIATDAWLPTHHATVRRRLGAISWQSWGTDNQIIASVQMLMNECATAMGRERPEWTENWAIAAKHRLYGIAQQTSRRLHHGLHSNALTRAINRDRSRGSAESGQPRKRRMSSTDHATLNVANRIRHRKSEATPKGFLLIVCAREECGGQARLLQQQFSEQLRCEVLIGTDSVDEWHSEVKTAFHGTVLLQTKSVLRHPVRLLQLFEATNLGHPMICVNVVGGGYDFAVVKPLLSSLSKELPTADMATLRTELAMHGFGKFGVGNLRTTLERAVPNAISVFFNPEAGKEMIDAAISDMIDKLGRGAAMMTSDFAANEDQIRRSYNDNDDDDGADIEAQPSPTRQLWGGWGKLKARAKTAAAVTASKRTEQAASVADQVEGGGWSQPAMMPHPEIVHSCICDASTESTDGMLMNPTSNVGEGQKCVSTEERAHELPFGAGPPPAAGAKDLQATVCTVLTTIRLQRKLTARGQGLLRGRHAVTPAGLPPMATPLEAPTTANASGASRFALRRDPKAISHCNRV